MSDLVLNAMRRNAEISEAAGLADRAKRIRSRIAAREAEADKASAPLSELTKAELLERAAEAEIAGRASMNKDELVEALEGGE